MVVNGSSGAVDRMREQQRIAGRRLDGPEIVELDDEPVVVEERRAGDLAAVVKGDRRARELLTLLTGQSVSQENSPFSTLRSQGSGIRKP